MQYLNFGSIFYRYGPVFTLFQAYFGGIYDWTEKGGKIELYPQRTGSPPQQGTTWQGPPGWQSALQGWSGMAKAPPSYDEACSQQPPGCSLHQLVNMHQSGYPQGAGHPPQKATTWHGPPQANPGWKPASRSWSGMPRAPPSFEEACRQQPPN